MFASASKGVPVLKRRKVSVPKVVWRLSTPENSSRHSPQAARQKPNAKCPARFYLLDKLCVEGHCLHRSQRFGDGAFGFGAGGQLGKFLGGDTVHIGRAYQIDLGDGGPGA